MKITKEKLKRLGKFKTASFALWNKNDISDTKYIKNNLSELHTNIVILGLNPSADVSFLKNFHYGRYDNWYREALSEDPFRGAYMTDLISEAEPSAQVILKKWRDNKKRFRENNIRNLEKQFMVLGAKNPVVVCIGYNTYNLFVGSGIGSKCIYRLKHPNSYRQKGRKKKFLSDARKLEKHEVLLKP